MATTVTATIGTGGDHATAVIWEAATDDDLTVADEVRKGLLLEVVSEQVTLSGATTDATRYRELTHNSALPYDHTTGVGPGISYSGGSALGLSEGNVHLTGILVECTHLNSSQSALIVNVTATGSIVDGCTLIRSNSNLGQSVNAGTVNGTSTTTLRNVLVVSSHFGIAMFHRDMVFENVTVLATTFGFLGTASTTYTTSSLTNCISMDSASGDFAATPAGTFCISSDTTASGWTSSFNLQISADIFKSPTGGDYHILASGNAFGNGTDLSTSFTTDIEGRTRDTWDIGAFQVALPASGAPQTPGGWAGRLMVR